MKPVVIKRDGCRVSFDVLRIKEAVLGASRSISDSENIIMDEAYATTVAEAVLAQFVNAEEVEIHAIQNAVETQLMTVHIRQLLVLILNIVTIVISLVRRKAV